MWKSNDLRESFLEFFESRKHLRMPSFSLIPVNDPTLLLIGAGMAPLKPFFKGEEEPPSRRITTCQKCVRADDIERVGRTSRHHTFFEMLGNFSFGDYYKEEAITWSWEYMIEKLKLNPARMWVTIHTDDEEAFKIWKNMVGVPPDRIIRLEDNFWGPIGLTGPCGPCSELCYDRGEEWSCGRDDCKPGCDCDRYVEVWNLVFTGLNKNESGEYLPLPDKCIDTGLGFERLVMLMQDKKSPFETELFTPIINLLEEMCGKKPGGNFDISVKIVADHIRAIAFMLADGIGPSNEGRGYVLRRILRRAARLGKVLGTQTGYLSALVDPVVETMGGIYPELRERKDYIKTIVRQEENNFEKTLEQGSLFLAEKLDLLLKKGETILSGEEVFRLYDTCGFPWELTREMAAERGISIDLEGFNRLLEEQKERARADQESKLILKSCVSLNLKFASTEFVGHERMSVEAEVLEILMDGNMISEAQEGDIIDIFLDRTPFYGESGGQVGDTGIMEGLNGNPLRVEITDTIKTLDGLYIHRGKVISGKIMPGNKVMARVNEARRKEIMRHHSATHLLQAALREILGKHVSQAGSLVSHDYFRFDFSHYQALSADEITRIERMVNSMIQENQPIIITEMNYDDALKKGALAFFGDKYSQTVRVVEMGAYSRELCGGTHAASTGEIGCFKIISENAIAAGIRRIEAVAGMSAIEYFLKSVQILKNLSQDLKVNFEEIPSSIERLKAHLKESEKEMDALRKEISILRAYDILSSAREVGEAKFILAEVPGATQQIMREMGDRLKEKIKSGVIILASEVDGKASLLAMVTPDLIEKGLNAGKIISQISPLVDGKGGGRADMAQAGGKNPARLKDALKKAEEIIGGSFSQ